MSNVDDIEIFTQNRVIRFFTDMLGYRYLTSAAKSVVDINLRDFNQ